MTPDVSIIDVIIPARNEAETIASVVGAIPRGVVRRVVVVDNGSTDATADEARGAGATVVTAERAGYGAACLAALAALPDEPSIIVFLVADGSDDPDEIAKVAAPLLAGGADLVIGSRFRGGVEPGAMTTSQRLGSAFAAGALTVRFGRVVTDLGPFRAIRRDTLAGLAMRDQTYGWTIEMQIKAARNGLRVVEVPVRWRRRQGGTPKVSGTWRGTLGASKSILGWLRGALLGPRFDPAPR